MSVSAAPLPPPSAKTPKEIPRGFRWNFSCLAVHTIVFRIGWVFKTETVLAPAFLETLGASAFVRGLLPLLQRLCISGPQIVSAHAAARLPRLKWAYGSLCIAMAVPWLAIAGMWRLGGPPGLNSPAARGMIVAFLALYSLFWMFLGAMQLFGGAALGKLIPADFRGRLLAASSGTGATAAILVVLALLPRWLKGEGGAPRYDWVFGAAGSLLVLSGALLFFLSEAAAAPSAARSRLRDFARGSLGLLLRDRNFALLAAASSLYLGLRALFPHFTVFGIQRLGLASDSLVSQVVAQNAVQAGAALLFGPLADRYGNRIVLRTLMGIGGLTPLMALGLAFLPGGIGAKVYWLVFACLGFYAIMERITCNYLLECVALERQAQYLGALMTVQIVPMLASPALGWMIDRFSYEAVFLLGSGAILLGVLLTFGLIEPRRRRPEDSRPELEETPE